MDGVSEATAERQVSARTGSYPRPVYAWYVVGVLLLANICSFIDRTIISLLIPDIKRDLQLTDTEISLLVGFVFALFYSVAGLPIGRMVDSRSRRGIIAIGITAWSVMTAACGLAREYWQLFLARMGVGVGEATLSPASFSLIADYFPPERLSLALSIYGSGAASGSGIALIIGGTIIAFTSSVGDVQIPVLGVVSNWGLIFLMVGLPGLLVAGLMATVKEPPRQDILVDPSVSRAASDASVPLRDVAKYLRANAATFTCLLVGFSMHAISGYGLMSWLPTFFHRTYGWNTGDAGILFGAMNSTLGAMGAVGAGWLADRLRRKGHADSRFRVGVLTALCVLPSALIFTLAGDENVTIAALAIYACVTSFPLGIGPAAVQELMPNRMRGQASAIYLFALALLGLTLGPTGVALITDYVFADESALRYSMAIVGGASMFISAVLLWSGRRSFVRSLAYKEWWIAERGGGRGLGVRS